MKECQPKIKEMYPDISNTERLRKVGEEWAKHKEALAATLEKEEVIKDKKEVIKEKEEVIKEKEEVVNEEEVIKEKEEVVNEEEDFSEITEVPVVEVKKAKKKSNK